MQYHFQFFWLLGVIINGGTVANKRHLVATCWNWNYKMNQIPFILLPPTNFPKQCPEGATVADDTTGIE